MIKVNHIYKTINHKLILNDLNLHVHKGSIYGLIGKNGSGKTTLIKHLIGEYIQDKGEITFNNHIVYENNDVKKDIAYISDDLYYPLNGTIKSMKIFYKNVFSTFNENKYYEMLKTFQLNESDKLRGLSKGMLKQVFFILSLSHNPLYLIMDEPLDGLDPISRKLFWKYIIDDVIEREMTVFISSHNLKELEDKCDCIGMIKDGHIINEFNLDDIKTNIHKVQVSFKESAIYDDLNILKMSTIGKVDTLIINNTINEIETSLNKYNPVILQFLPLTLEELFIYELGEDDYE